jgi:hypothetical protein
MGFLTDAGEFVGGLVPGGAGVGKTIGGALDRFTGKKGTDGGPDINKISADTGYTVEQVRLVVGYQEQTSKDHYDDIAEFAARTPGRFQQLLDKYNANNSPKIVKDTTYWGNQYAQMGQATVQQAIPQPTSLNVNQLDQYLGARSAQVVQAVPQPTSATASANGLGNVGDYGKGALNGAIDGLTDVFLKTQQGQKTVDKGAADFFSRNGLKIAAGAVPVASFITWLAIKAFNK